MVLLASFSEHWFDFIQTAGVVGGLLFTALTIRKDERARRISNLIAINEQYNRIWEQFYQRPELARVLKKDADLNKQPVTDAEWLFVKTLILHLDTVRRATLAKVFVSLDGLQKDVKEFFGLPIPKVVWEKIKQFQDKAFVKFIEASLK